MKPITLTIFRAPANVIHWPSFFFIISVDLSRLRPSVKTTMLPTRAIAIVCQISGAVLIDEITSLINPVNRYATQKVLKSRKLSIDNSESMFILCSKGCAN